MLLGIDWGMPEDPRPILQACPTREAAGIMNGLRCCCVAQAGPGELRRALEGCGALELDGRWHVLEPGYHDMFCEVMVLTAIQNGWQLPRLPLSDMVQELTNDNFDTRLAISVTKLYTCLLAWPKLTLIQDFPACK